MAKSTSAQDLTSRANSQFKQIEISADTKSNLNNKTACNGIPSESKDAIKYFKKSVNGDDVVTKRPPLRAGKALKFSRGCDNIINKGGCRTEATKKKSEIKHKSPERKRIKGGEEDTSFTHRFQKLNIEKSDLRDRIDGPESFNMTLNMSCDDDNSNQHHLFVPINSTFQSIPTFREQKACPETEPYGMIQGISCGSVAIRPSLRSDTMNSFNDAPSTSSFQNGKNFESMRKNMLPTPMDSIVYLPNYLSYQSHLSSKTFRKKKCPMPMDSIVYLPSYQSDLSSKTIRENRSPTSMDSFTKLPVNSLSSEVIIQDAFLGSNLNLDRKCNDIEESFVVLETDR